MTCPSDALRVCSGRYTDASHPSDLGLTFVEVLVLICILVTGWFQSFRIPLTIMNAIPWQQVRQINFSDEWKMSEFPG